MERWNGEGIPREQLISALGQPHVVMECRKNDKCLLCRRKGVNESALCVVCMSLLRPEEEKLVERWLSGVGP